MKPNYELKSAILNSDYLKEYKDINKAIYNFMYDKNIATPYNYEQALNKQFELFYNNDEIYKECKRIDKAFLNRKQRLKSRIFNMLEKGTCYFLTLTFEDNFINLKDNTKRRYVTDYLKSISNIYIANQDFGSKTNREHYHAIILADSIDINWKYGFQCNLKCYGNKDNKLGIYVAKLSNHAIKNTNKRSVMIYSKCQ